MYVGRTQHLSHQVLNNSHIHSILGVDKFQYGWIITVGWWGYAVFVLFNGTVVDAIGARRSLLIGCLGSGIMNIILGIYSQFSTLQGWGTIAVYCILFGLNNYVQTFSTAAIVKCGVNWYHVTERGFFGGIFGVIIAFGFFLSLQVNGVIYAALPWYWLFYIPGISMITLFFIDLPVIRSVPEDAGFRPVRLILSDTGDVVYNSNAAPGALSSQPEGVQEDGPRLITDVKSSVPTPWRENVAKFKATVFMVIKRVWVNPVFLILFACEVCIGWCRDGILSWYVGFLHDFWGVEVGGTVFTVASGGITIGAMFGALLAGIISDVLFHSRRPPVAFLACVGLTGIYVMLRFSVNAWMAAVTIGLTSFFFSAAHGIVTSTCAMDFAGSEATGTAVGLLDGIQKLSSSATGAAMGAIVQGGGYLSWTLSMIPGSVLASLLFLLIIRKKAPELEEKKKGVASEDERLLAAGFEEEPGYKGIDK